MNTICKSIELDYRIIFETKSVHLLEKNFKGFYYDLPNKIGPEFQETFIEQENLPRLILDFKWFCYPHSGPILEYKGRNLSLVRKDEKILYKPFLSV